MTTLNTTDHPNVQFAYDIDGVIHFVSQMGDVWCDDEDIELDGRTSQPTDLADVCAGCMKAGREEGLVKD